MLYDSGITAQSLIENLCTELDVPTEFSVIEKSELVQSLNTIEKILYKNIIREIFCTEVAVTSNIITLPVINSNIASTYSTVSFSDIVRLQNKSDSKEFTKCSLDKFSLFSNAYCVNADSIKINPSEGETISSVQVYMVVCPAEKVLTKDGINGNVNVPYEFIPMIKAYIRGELYKVINEDDIAAKWIADFNSQLENFKQYVASASALIG